MTGRIVTKTGEVIDLAAWKKTDKKGNAYYSLKHGDREVEAESDFID